MLLQMAMFIAWNNILAEKLVYPIIRKQLQISFSNIINGIIGSRVPNYNAEKNRKEISRKCYY